MSRAPGICSVPDSPADRAGTPQAEAWFVNHGLPYFVDHVRDDVRRNLRPRSLALVGSIAALAGLALWLVLDVLLKLPSEFGFVVGSQLFLVLIAIFAVVRLRAGVITTWAARRTFGSLGLLFPLITRALPLLLLFVTFLFINTEVWQVASRLDGAVMWVTVLLFTAVAVGFLAVRLPEELDVFDEQLDAAQIRTGCRGTPLAGIAEASPPEELDVNADHISGLQKVNLVLVLLVAQLIQVLLLSASVFAFFLLFGVVAIDPKVIESWLLENDSLHPLLGRDSLSQELLQVSVFLSAFSGLYFTVYAVSDENYRKHFFSAVLNELQQAISARAAYRVLRRRAEGR
jgi:hypothetical protein